MNCWRLGWATTMMNNRGMSADEDEGIYPEELTDRQVYDTPIGPVCMSKREYQDYQDRVAMRQTDRDKDESHDEKSGSDD